VKRALATIAILLAAACASGPRGGSTSTTPGAISIAINPNPIVAKAVRGTVYEFPFEVIVRETGGRQVEIERVSAEVFALGGFKVAEESYDQAKIRALGHPTTIPANGEVRLRFAQRHEVPDERLFRGVRADLRVEAVDAGGVRITSTTSVTVTK
jgi:hypothetical protein